jgi:hypothetical protein
MTISRLPRLAGISLLALTLVAVSFVSVLPVRAATTAEAEFYFANGEVLTGITGGGDFVIPNEFFEDYYAPNPVPFTLPITIHVSCSESFPGGWSGGDAFPSSTNPDHADWQIASYYIQRNLGGGQIRECSETAIPGSITVIKLTTPTTSADFSFTLDGAIPPLPGTNGTEWSAFSGSAAVAGNGGSFQWTQLAAGNYSLAETIAQNPAGYDFTSFACSNGLNGAVDAIADFSLHGDEHVVCTFLNEGEVVLVPDVDIEKATNGHDADAPTGPGIMVGEAVEWTYVVTNTGETPLTGVSVVDNMGVAVLCPADVLAVGASMTCTANGTATPGQYSNLGTVTTNEGVSDEDPSHYFGLTPDVDIEKATNGFDADSATGPWLVVGSDVTWTYVVTNNGELPLTGVTVTDDILGEICVIGDLAVGESDTCTASGTATIGQYANIGTVDTDQRVTDSDPSHYYGFIPEEPGVDIEKATNGEDADLPTGPAVLVSDPVTWTYLVSNTGNIQLTGVTVTDDQGVEVLCPADTLDVGESMECSATGVASRGQYANIGTVDTDQEVTDSDPSHYIGYDVGSIGNFVWFDSDKDGIQDAGEAAVEGVVVSLYEGETCSGEPIAELITDADGKYLFEDLLEGTYCVEFDLPAAYLFSPADQGSDDELDSDAAVQVVALAEGEDDLSVDAGLVGGDIVFEKETTVETETMFDFVFNGTEEVSLADGESATFHVPGGTYSITELAVDGWELLSILCGDIDTEIDLSSGTVSLFVPPGGSVACTFLNDEIEDLLGVIGDFVWNDTNENGIQDQGEAGIAGVTVELFDADTDVLVLSTATDANGIYIFGNVPEGSYYLQFTGPAGWEFTLVDQGSSDLADSDAFFVDEIAVSGGESGASALPFDADILTQEIGQTATFELLAGVADTSRDAGLTFVQVSPTTIVTTTTVAPTTSSIAATTIATTPETLPFTGFGQVGVGGLAVMLVALGGMVLAMVGRREDGQEVIAEDAPLRAWEA